MNINYFFILICLTIISCNPLRAKEVDKSLLEPLDIFLKTQNASQTLSIELVKKQDIPFPYSYLVSQPLMTIGIATYYNRTPKILEPLYEIYNDKTKTYSRGILMIIDKNIERNDPLIANHLGESTVVEIGFITINLSLFPENVINEILNTHIPFGAILKKNSFDVNSSNVNYIKIECDHILKKYIACKNKLFGRTNTLVRKDNNMEVARVVEILTES